MGIAKSVYFCGVSEDEQAVFRDLLTTLTMLRRVQWTITDKPNADIALVDRDSQQGVNFLQQSQLQPAATGSPAVIEYGGQWHYRCAHPQLLKPLRARDFLNCLNKLTRQLDGGQLSLSRSRCISLYQLLKPLPETFVRDFQGGAELAGVFKQECFSLSRAAQLAQVDLDQAQMFMTACLKHGYAQACQVALEPEDSTLPLPSGWRKWFKGFTALNHD